MRKATIILTLFLTQLIAAPAGLFNPGDGRTFLKDKATDDCFDRSYYQALGNSICLILPKSDVQKCIGTGTGTVYLPCEGGDIKLPYSLATVLRSKFGGEMYNPCASTKFTSAKVAGNGGGGGTGFAIGKDLVMTASHVIRDLGGVSNIVCLFGVLDYSVPGKCSNPSTNTNVRPLKYFEVTSMYKDYDSPQNAKNRDIAIIKLDHCISGSGIEPLSLFQDSDPKSFAVGKEIFSIGHPYLLQMMYSDKAVINSTITASAIGFGTDASKFPPVDSFSHYLVTSLDIMAGNSGSPVFIKDNNLAYKVIGIVTNSSPEYRYTNSGNCVEEIWHTESDFQNQPAPAGYYTLVQTFQGVQFPLDNYSCPTVVIPPCGIIPPDPKCTTYYGQRICLQVPTSLFSNKIYSLNWGGNTYATNKVYGGDYVCRVIQNGTTYRPEIYEGGAAPRMLHSFGISGTANGTEFFKQICPDITNTTSTAVSLVIQPPLSNAQPGPLSFSTLNSPDGNIPHIVHFYPIYNNGNEAQAIWLWNFGDGTSSTEQFPSHKYVKPGTYTVKCALYLGTYKYGEITKTDFIHISPQVEAINDLLGTINFGTKPLAVGTIPEKIVNKSTIQTSGAIEILDGTTINTVGAGSVTIQSK